MLLAVPIILVSQDISFAKDFIEAMKPDYDVIHVTHTLEIARDELPALLSGKAQKPASNLGSNMHNASIAHSGKHPTPYTVIISAGWSDDEFKELQSAVGKDTVPTLRDGGAGATGADEVAKRAKDCLKTKGVEPGVKDVSGKGEVWTF